MIEHTIFLLYLIICTALSIVCLIEPYWAVCTASNSFCYGSNFVLYIGFWEKCTDYPNDDNTDGSCQTYGNVAQSVYPAYFIYGRWTLCISAGLIGLSAVLTIFSNPWCLPKIISTTGKFTIRLVVSIFILIASILSIVAESWFCWTTYADELQQIVAPGTTLTDQPGATGYTPDWCVVVMLCVSCSLLIAGILHMVRACLIYSNQKQAEKKYKQLEEERAREAARPTSNLEIYSRNQMMRTLNGQYNPPRTAEELRSLPEVRNLGAEEKVEVWKQEHQVYL